MESEKTEKIEVVGKQEEQDPNRGMSKKEQRRVEVLKHSLVPRIEKLETQINEQMEKLNSLSDKREGDSSDLTVKGKEGLEFQEGLETGNTETSQDDANQKSSIEKLVGALQAAGLGSDLAALRLVAELAALDSRKMPVAKASHLIQPSGGGIPPTPDLRAEYEKRVIELRPGDIDGLMEVKREFRRRGMEVY